MKILNNLRARIARCLLKRKIKRKCAEANNFLAYTQLNVPDAEKQMAYTLGVEIFNEVVELCEIYHDSKPL